MSLVTGYHSNLQRLLDRIYEVKLALYVHGTFGIGKTEAIRRFAMRKATALGLEFSEDFNDINNEKKFMFLPIILHQYDSAELKGLPFPNEKRDKTIYLPVGILPTAGHGIIFFDEINLAAPMMQNNAYQIIEDRRLGFYTVPDGYTSVGAGNLVDDRGNTFENPMPLNNRFIHFQLNVPTVDDITITEPDENGNEQVVETIKGWVNDYALPAGVDHRVINFLSYQRSYLYRYNPQADSQEIAVASPRIWKKVSDLIKGIPTEEYDFISQLVGGGAGAGMGLEFSAWLKLSRKYDIANIYKTGKVAPIPREVDQLYSLMSALVGYYLEDQKDTRAVRLLEISRLFSKEHTVMVLNQAKSLDPKFFSKIKGLAPEKFSKFADDIFNLLI